MMMSLRSRTNERINRVTIIIHHIHRCRNMTILDNSLTERAGRIHVREWVAMFLEIEQGHKFSVEYLQSWMVATGVLNAYEMQQ